MRFMSRPFLILLSSTFLTAQQLPEWYPVYTFDESIVEMNTSLVTIAFVLALLHILHLFESLSPYLFTQIQSS